MHRGLDLLRRWLLRAAVAALCAPAATAQVAPASVEVEGTRFRSAIELGGETLVLNGVGVRTRLVFKVYAAGLYLPARATDAEAILRQPGSKRVALRFLREVDADLFINSLLAGFSANLPAAEVQRLQPRTDALVATLRSIGSVQRGEWVDFEYTPRFGTRLILNGATHGEHIAGEDFFSAVLRVWLGTAPAYEPLKRGMLGLTGSG
jgi:hypothetical protein